jgi:hypothetical protein
MDPTPVTLAVADAVSSRWNASGGGPPVTSILLGNRPGFCSLLRGTNASGDAILQIANLTALEIDLVNTAGQGDLVPGTYDVPGGSVTPPVVSNATPTLIADAIFFALDANCQSVLDVFQSWGTAGTVTVTSTQPAVSGTYTLTLDTGDQITGSFTGPSCDGFTFGGVPSTAVCEK